MLPSSRFKLLFGPYRTPPVRPGAVLFDEARDCQVAVCGLTDRCPDPVAIGNAARARSPVVCGALAEAVRKESRLAVGHWFGVSDHTVSKCRKASASVGDDTPGRRASDVTAVAEARAY